MNGTKVHIAVNMNETREHNVLDDGKGYEKC